jgi:putative ATPase
MDLFEQHYQQVQETEAPLAARMRPQTLEEFVGQDHILAPGRLLRRAIAADQLSSLIFSGPPGTGKTTLSRIIANTTRAHFITLNAVLAGVKDIREAIAAATEKRKLSGQRTILFIDEVHRFNKSQQDALLPWVENGTVTLIGATTENPYFEVNKALISRSRLFQLKPLAAEDLRQIVRQALGDRQRGYGNLAVEIAPEALNHLIDVANGDARALLNALELAVETTPADEGSIIQVSLAVAEESIQQRAVLYDKEGDAHFDTISAFIKSVRGSDPDAALYWLAKMVYAGENPRFIFRRLLILASEDVGLADPQAVVIAQSCAAAFEQVGMPEGRYHLAQATLYLATAPKSNSLMGFFDALAAVEGERESDVPNHLKDASRDQKGFGHGVGYLYPHAYRDHWVAQQYLPRNLQGQVFYQPAAQGFEGQIQEQVARQREAQLAASVEAQAEGEMLTYGEGDRAAERWWQRTLSQVGGQLAQVRERVFVLASPQRHHLVLDLNASSGLLTWEAVRRVPEGGVYACTRTLAEAESLRELAGTLPELLRPVVIEAKLPELPTILSEQTPEVQFDRIIGRNALMGEADKSQLPRRLLPWLSDGGILVLAESVPRQGQRLYQLLTPAEVGKSLYGKWVEAEEAIYQSPHEPSVNWDVAKLQSDLAGAGFTVQVEVEPMTAQIYISPALLQRWFTATEGTRPSYAVRLAATLAPSEVRAIEKAMNRKLVNQTVSWSSAIAFCCCHQ